MSQETQSDQAQQLQLQTSQIDDEDIDEEAEIQPQNANFYDKVYQMAEKFAATSIGHFVIERADRLLQMIEDTAKWSLPQDASEEPLVRPFGWITFIMLIIMLRLIRISLSVAALMIGNSPVSAQDMVYFLQIRRRKLRAIRMNGLKLKRQREEAQHGTKTGAGGAGGLISNLRVLLSRAICRPGQTRETGRRIFIYQGKPQECEEQENNAVDRQSTKRPRDDESVDQNLTFDQMLSKYADEDSEEDSDFEPNPEEEEDDDDDSTSHADSSSSSDEVPENNAAANEEAAKKSSDTDKNKLNTTGNHKSQLDQSVEIKENGGGHHRPMPLPIIEVKQEQLSDIESGNELVQTPKEHGATSNGNDSKTEMEAHKEMNTSTLTNNQLNAYTQKSPKKSTPGHESAAIMKVVPTLGTTATAAPSTTDANTETSELSQSKSFPSNMQSSVFVDELVLSLCKLDLALSPALHRPNRTFQRQSSNSSCTSNSSSEDIFYSPIAHSTPKDSDIEKDVDSNESPNSSSAPKKNVQHQNPNKQNHQHKYRGKNRR